MQEKELKELFSGNRKEKRFLSGHPLGILQLIRYAAEEGLALTPWMYEGISYAGKNPAAFSAKEAGEELERILMSDQPESLLILVETNTMRLFLPELSAMFETAQKNPHHIYSVGEHTIHCMKKVPPKRELRWAALLHDAGKLRTHTADMYGTDHFHGHEKASVRIGEAVLSRLGILGKETILTLIEYHDAHIHQAEEWVEKLGIENFYMLILLKEADLSAKSPHLYERAHEELVRLLEEAQQIEKRISQ